MPVKKVKSATQKSKVTKAGLKVSKTSKFSVPVFNLSGKKTGVVSLPKEIFGAKVNKKLMAQAVRVYLASRRQGGASTKTRGEVAGSTRKIYRQKGTGRARHGAITAPIFRGGGIVFGPRPRDFSLKLPRQMKKKALFSALSARLADNKIFIVHTQDSNGKTKQIFNMLKTMNLTKKANVDKILFVADSNNVAAASRNISGLSLRSANSINTFDVLKNNYVVIAKESMPKIESVFLGKEK